MPVSSDRSDGSDWSSADDHADVAASISISRLVSGVLEGRAEQTVTTGHRVLFFFFTDRTDKQIKKDPDSPQLSSEDFGR